MTQSEFLVAYQEVLQWLRDEAGHSGNIALPSLARELVHSARKDSLVLRQVKAAIFGLLMSQHKISEDNVKWLLRDEELGFPESLDTSFGDRPLIRLKDWLAS